MTLAAAFSVWLAWGRVEDGREGEKTATVQKEEKCPFEELCVLLLLCGILVQSVATVK